MFICSMTGRLSQPGEKPIRVIVKRREREYLNPDGQVVGHGWEIEKEILICEDAVKMLPAQSSVL
jgi:hypothetical protein